MLIHQPFQAALGDTIIEQLQSRNYREFKFIVAYAKTSGVNRLLPYMAEFKVLGGRISGVVGIDQLNTSYEALVSLCNICDELYVYHSEDLMKTFHVKAYSLNGDNAYWNAIGSHNFTAGGLFSNYEASTISTENNVFFSTLFASYSDTSSPCCKKLNQGLIDLLLEKHYIQKEQTLARQKIAEASRQKNRPRTEILFGRDTLQSRSAANRVSTDNQDIDEPTSVIDNDKNYLIRFVPRAGDRSQQVHFTIDILQNFFSKKADDHLRIQQILDIYNPRPIEERQIVFSQKNRNVRIEVEAAEYLNHNYPTDDSKRPILLFKKVNPNFFEYMLLIDGNAGYSALNARLHSLDWHKKSLQYEMVDADILFSLWEDCPLV